MAESESQDEEVASIMSPPCSRGSPVPILKTSVSRTQSTESPPPRKLLHLRSLVDGENEQSREDSIVSTETIVDAEKQAAESPVGQQSQSDRLTLVVDGTRFVVSRRLFVSHPNTMLGRWVIVLE